MIVNYARDFDEARKSEPGKVIYLKSEVEELKKHRGDPELIRKIHHIKDLFDGEILLNMQPAGNDFRLRSNHLT